MLVAGLVLIGYVHTGNDAGANVVENQLGKDFLNLENALDTVRISEGDTVFQEKEGGFNAPAEVIEVLKILYREILNRQICNKILHVAIIERKLDKAEGEMKGRGLVR